MKPYSAVQWERIVHAADRGEFSQREITRDFDLDHSFVVSLLQHWRRAGNLARKPHGVRAEPSENDRIRQFGLVHRHPEITLARLKGMGVFHCSTASSDGRFGGLKRRASGRGLHTFERDRL